MKEPNLGTHLGMKQIKRLNSAIISSPRFSQTSPTTYFSPSTQATPTVSFLLTSISASTSPHNQSSADITSQEQKSGCERCNGVQNYRTEYLETLLNSVE